MVPHWDLFGAEGYVIDESKLGPWDILKFDGNRVPGTIPEGGIKVTRKMSIKLNKPHGGDGATVVQNGYEPAEVDIVIRVTTGDEWEGLQVLLARYWRFPGKDSRQDRPGESQKDVKSTGAIDVESPYFDFPNKVAAIVLLSVSNPEPGPEKGTRVIKIKAYEYIAASKKKATRKGVGRTAQVPEHQIRERAAVKNAAGAPPSATQAVPSAPRKPGSGSS